MSVTEQNDSRLHFLLLVRVIATFAVVFGHASSFYGAFKFTQWPNFPYVQSISVTVFFCVSGYTIAWVCDRSQRSGMEGFKSFTFDRVARLHIPLIPFLLICAVMEPVILGGSHPYPKSSTFSNLIGNFLFLQWLAPDFIKRALGGDILPFGLNRPLWTLAIEFWTYILFAGIFFALRRQPRRLSPILISGIAAMVLGKTIYSGVGEGLPVIWLLSAGAYFLLKSLPPVNQTAQILAALALLPPTYLLFTSQYWPETGDYSWPYNLLILTCFIISIIVASSTTKNPNKVTLFFGSFAYSVYITHYPLMYLLHRSGIIPSGEAGALISSGLCLGFGWLFSLPFEQRYRMIRERLRPIIFRNLSNKTQI